MLVNIIRQCFAGNIIPKHTKPDLWQTPSAFCFLPSSSLTTNKERDEIMQDTPCGFTHRAQKIAKGRWWEAWEKNNTIYIFRELILYYRYFLCHWDVKKSRSTYTVYFCQEYFKATNAFIWEGCFPLYDWVYMNLSILGRLIDENLSINPLDMSWHFRTRKKHNESLLRAACVSEVSEPYTWSVFNDLC